ncbi:hypothetical protein RUND412_004013, partial [Rhizina undulata]
GYSNIGSIQLKRECVLKMVGFLVILLSNFAHAAPLANNSAIMPLWVPTPRGRGTINILITCLLTITICVWTALHLNIDPRHWFWRMLLNTSKYVASGIFWPEFVLFAAASQWAEARNLRQRIRTHRLGQEKDYGNFSPTRALQFLFESHSDEDYQGLTMEIAFYAVMGGFAWKSNSSRSNSEKQSNPKEDTLTPDGFLEIVKKNLLSLETVKRLYDDVKALSKSDILAKVLACTQASWFVIQCLARKASGLPVTLIELHTATHVMCALHVTHRLFIEDYVDKSVLERKQKQEHVATSSSVERRPASWTALTDESETSLLTNPRLLYSLMETHETESQMKTVRYRILICISKQRTMSIFRSNTFSNSIPKN